MHADKLAELLAQLIVDFGGNKKAFAAAVGISAPSLSHLLKPNRATTPPGIELCLRIAKAADCSASMVLRAAGKEHIADLIENRYGPAAFRRMQRHQTITPFERVLLKQFRSMPKVQQRAVRILMQATAEETSRRRTRRRTERARLVGRARVPLAKGA